MCWLKVMDPPFLCANRYLHAGMWAEGPSGLEPKSVVPGQWYHQPDSTLTALPPSAQQMARVCWWCLSKAVESLDTVNACPLKRVTSGSQVWGGFEGTVSKCLPPKSLLATPEADVRVKPRSYDLEKEGCSLMKHLPPLATRFQVK